MKIFRELIIILVIYFVGEFISKTFNLPIPGNILGMILLFIMLYIGIIKVEQVNAIATFFLDHLAFFFIPAGVGLMNSFGEIKSSAFKILIICFITTIIAMVATGLIVQVSSRYLAKRQEKKSNDKGVI